MKKLMAAAMILFGALAANAALVFQDSFNYTASVAPSTTNYPGTATIGGTWGSGIGTNSVYVVGGSLPAPSGLAMSSGNMLKIGAGSSMSSNTFAGGKITNGVVYMSYLIQINTNKSGAYVPLGPGMAATTGFINPFCQLGYSNTAGNAYFNLGIGGRSGAAAPLLANQYTLGQTLLIVTSYNWMNGAGNDVGKIWINPSASSFGSGAEPVADQTIVYTSEAGTNGLAEVYIRNGSSTPGYSATVANLTGIANTNGVFVDEIRVGTTWNDVTPIPEPATVGMLGLGALVVMLVRRMRA